MSNQTSVRKNRSSCQTAISAILATSQHVQAQNRQVALGSFHRSPKNHSRLIGVWAQSLNQALNTKILIKIKYLNVLDIQSNILEQFTNHGIDPTRIVFRGPPK